MKFLSKSVSTDFQCVARFSELSRELVSRETFKASHTYCGFLWIRHFDLVERMLAYRNRIFLSHWRYFEEIVFFVQEGDLHQRPLIHFGRTSRPSISTTVSAIVKPLKFSLRSLHQVCAIWRKKFEAWFQWTFERTGCRELHGVGHMTVDIESRQSNLVEELSS